MPKHSKAVLKIENAREHNLKNVSLELPKNKLAVFTGVSGSGKSSLAYDTIFKEGQRRYIASLSAYARQFMSQMEKPQVDLIEGLSPTISIDQKTVGRNPRSTVGTITEVADFLRLLFSRLGTPHCPNGHGAIEGQSSENISDGILRDFEARRIYIMAPVILERKGEYRKDIDSLRSQGFARIRLDGKVYRLDEKLPDLARYEKHSLEAVIDRLQVKADERSRVDEAVKKALSMTEGLVSVLDADSEKARYFSTANACPVCQYSIPELEPRLFSFNNPRGACEDCQGLGYHQYFDESLFIKDENRTLFDGALYVLNDKGHILFLNSGREELSAILKKNKIPLDTAWKAIPAKVKQVLLHGETNKHFSIVYGLNYIYEKYKIPMMEKYMSVRSCETCDGRRLNQSALHVQFRGKNITDISAMTVAESEQFFSSLTFKKRETHIGEPILRELHERLVFLREVGLDYLGLDRRANTLSGGEAQRIRLASQVGSGLEGCLYILDEPSIGLHQSDNRKLIDTLKTLRSRGNTVYVIEHDEDTILSADHLIDVGPGAGSQGGEISFNGAPQAMLKRKRSPNETAQFLKGEKSIVWPSSRRKAKDGENLKISGASQFHLKTIDVDIPLGCMIGLSGVSGSGKSTLVHEVLRPNVQRYLSKKKSKLVWQNCEKIEGLEWIDQLIEVDQKAIGRTPRSNPVTYTKAMDSIRDLFASLPEAKARGYKKGRFSFNVKGGRCEHCGGAGLIELDMQLFSKVEVQCEVCDGRRFNDGTLEIRYKGKSIYDVLQMTVDEATDFFEAVPKLYKILSTLKAIGLGYIHLGQSSTTLSGGEAQRVKLASELAKNSRGKTLYLLDEPTTGLHFEDIRKLLEALQQLVEKGNTVLIIEHNLDVLKSVDYLIELGPEGGEKGGYVLAACTPDEILNIDCPTGIELKRFYEKQHSPLVIKEKEIEAEDSLAREIIIQGLRENNLKNLSFSLPKNQWIAVTGVSGSGKSSIAFDTLFQEGQRKYIESLSTYARRFLGRMGRPQADKIIGISPTIAVDQHSASRNPRSTVSTATELYDSFRVLFAHIAKVYAPGTSTVLEQRDVSRLSQDILKKHERDTVDILVPLLLPGRKVVTTLESLEQWENYQPFLKEKGYLRLLVNHSGKHEILRLDKEEHLSDLQEGLKKESLEGLYLMLDRFQVEKERSERLQEAVENALSLGEELLAVRHKGTIEIMASYYYHSETDYAFTDRLSPRHFSFNHHLGACERCEGIGKTRTFSPSALMKDASLPLLKGAMQGDAGKFFTRRGNFYGRQLKMACREAEIDVYETPWEQLTKEEQRFILYGEESAYSQGAAWGGMARVIEDLAIRSESEKTRKAFMRCIAFDTCPVCRGDRLKPSILAMKLEDKNIAALTSLSVHEALHFFEHLSTRLSSAEMEMVDEVINDILFKLRSLDSLGLSYLDLNRSMATLSGGEAQRIRLSSQISNKLNDVLYVLDEPSIGLHQRDSERLIRALRELTRRRNTVIMVEHDLDAVMAADWLLDIGPAAGEKGGELLFNGPVTNRREMAKKNLSFSPYLKTKSETFSWTPRKVDLKTDDYLLFGPVHQHNIKNQQFHLPLARLSGLSGVSGSGKSSFIDWALPRLKRLCMDGFPKDKQDLGILRFTNNELSRLVPFQSVYAVDQSPLAASRRSTTASYLDIMNNIRDVFARSRHAKEMGFSVGHFSFNSPKGQCPACNGSGIEEIEMHFISDVQVACESCGGKRFNREVLRAKYRGRSVAEVLKLTYNEAHDYFENFPSLQRKIQMMIDTGLGYMQLGLSTSILSGGERQRLKLVKELAQPERDLPNLYILDEPTTGLHLRDIESLLQLIQQLIDKGHTVLAIEHHIAFLRSCDQLIEMGPEAGNEGGQVLFSGSVDAMRESQQGHTWRYL